MKRLALVLAGLLLPLALSAQTSLIGNDACATLVRDGVKLVRESKFKEALAQFERAGKEDPKASGPLSGRAFAFYVASTLAGPDQAASYRATAEELVKAALAREPRDPLALEVSRFLDQGTPKERYPANPKAKELLEAGETLFQADRFAEAKAKYLAAFDADPGYADALVYAGDCDFVRKDYAQAVILFRRALTLDPRHEKGWRYLADALHAQGQDAEAREALVSGIAALPRYLPTWATLADMPGPGPAWKSLGLKPKARAVKNAKTGGFNVEVDPDMLAGAGKDSIDGAVWLAYGLTQVTKEQPPKPGQPKLSPFQADLAAWTTTLKVADELAGKGKPLTDPTLLQMQAFHKAGDLEACLFLLTFKETYREDFEAWKQAHPAGVRTFLETWRIRP